MKKTLTKEQIKNQNFDSKWKDTPVMSWTLCEHVIQVKLFREYFYNEEQLYYLLTTAAGHDLWELIYNDVNVL